MVGGVCVISVLVYGMVSRGGEVGWVGCGGWGVVGWCLGVVGERKVVVEGDGGGVGWDGRCRGGV